MNHLPIASEPSTEPITVEAFKAEVTSWAEKIGLEPAEIHVRPMKRKWASWSSRGRLSFDRDILGQPETFRSEVIVHELVHQKVPHHGALFWAVVRSRTRIGPERESLDAAQYRS